MKRLETNDLVKCSRRRTFFWFRYQATVCRYTGKLGVGARVDFYRQNLTGAVFTLEGVLCVLARRQRSK